MPFNIAKGYFLFALILSFALLQTGCGHDPNVSVQEQLYSKKEVDALRFYFSMDTVTEIPYYTGDLLQVAKPYKDKLIIAPGIYNIAGQVIDFRKEGLYRILFPLKENYQIVVFKDDVIRLVSSLSWIITHGDANDTWTYGSLINKAKTDKLYITCEKANVFAQSILTKHGIKTRIIQGVAIEKPNGYDEGHVLSEVFIPAYDKWVLVDFDNNSIFKAEGVNNYLDMMEFKNALAKDSLQIVPLSLDIKVDVSQFKARDYSFGFYSEAISANDMALKKWYRRVMEVTLIDKYYYVPTDTNFVKGRYADAMYISGDAFRDKFYK